MEKKAWREKFNDFDGKNRRKTKRLPFTRSSPPPPNLRHVQSTLVRSEWLQNNIFWTRTTTKTGGIHFGRACMHAWLSVLTKTGHSRFLDCWCWAFMTSSSRRSHKTRKPALEQTPSDHNTFLHHALIREVQQTSIKTHHNMWAIDVRIHVYKI